MCSLALNHPHPYTHTVNCTNSLSMPRIAHKIYQFAETNATNALEYVQRIEVLWADESKMCAEFVPFIVWLLFRSFADTDQLMLPCILSWTHTNSVFWTNTIEFSCNKFNSSLVSLPLFSHSCTKYTQTRMEMVCSLRLSTAQATATTTQPRFYTRSQLKSMHTHTHTHTPREKHAVSAVYAQRWIWCCLSDRISEEAASSEHRQFYMCRYSE